VFSIPSFAGTARRFRRCISSGCSSWGLVGSGGTESEPGTESELPSTTSEVKAQTPITRIAFGSCNDQATPQPLWAPIRAAEPDLWIWMGDNVYADTPNMTALDSIYARQNRRPGYRALRESTRVIGTWDDHDYGVNDASCSYPKRDRSQAHVLDFMDVPEDHPAGSGRASTAPPPTACLGSA
jgi:alkaline phosphatase D